MRSDFLGMLVVYIYTNTHTHTHTSAHTHSRRGKLYVSFIQINGEKK